MLTSWKDLSNCVGNCMMAYTLAVGKVIAFFARSEIRTAEWVAGSDLIGVAFGD